MIKLAIQVPVLSAAVLGGSLILADGMIVAALMVSFVSLVLLAAMARLLGSARVHRLARHKFEPANRAPATVRAPSRRP